MLLLSLYTNFCWLLRCALKNRQYSYRAIVHDRDLIINSYSIPGLLFYFTLAVHHLKYVAGVFVLNCNRMETMDSKSRNEIFNKLLRHSL